jgi:predicted ArsR family transcriptional regulator
MAVRPRGPKKSRRRKSPGRRSSPASASRASGGAQRSRSDLRDSWDGAAGSRAILTEILKREGESDVATLAERLGVTGVAVRQHLAAMEREGQVGYRSVRRPVGRPARMYRLTDAAEQLFPQTSGRVALDLLARLERSLGPETLERLFATRLNDLSREYRKLLKSARSWTRKLQLLAETRDSEGYLCDLGSAPRSEVKGGVRLVEHHCPVSAIAEQHPQVCDYELKLFRRVLGEPGLRRIDHIRNGGHSCSYEAPKKKN